MAGVTGRVAKMAFAKFAANSWGVATSVTKGVYFQSTGGMKLAPARINDEAFGQNFMGPGSLGNVDAPDLQWVGRSRYDDHSYILDALAMGSPSAVTISTSATGQVTSWLHVIDLAPSIDGLGITAAIDKSLFVDELTSAKVYGFSESVGDNGVMDKAYKVLGSKPTNISSININSTVAGANFPGLTNRISRQQGTLRMNVQGGGALAATDKVDAETIEFSFERPQDAPHIFGQDYVMEPADAGFPMAELKVNYPRMTTTSASSLYAALRTANVVFKADWIFNGVYINSTDTFQRKYQFPHLELDETNGFEVEGAQQVKPAATFRAKLAATSPTGMAFVNPFRLSLIHSNSVVAF